MQTWIFYPGKGDKRLIDFSKSGDIIGDIYVIEKREDVPSCEPPVLFLTAGARVFGVETVLKGELETASAKLRPNQTEAEAHAFVTKRCPKRKNIFAAFYELSPPLVENFTGEILPFSAGTPEFWLWASEESQWPHSARFAMYYFASYGERDLARICALLSAETGLSLWSDLGKFFELIYCCKSCYIDDEEPDIVITDALSARAKKYLIVMKKIVRKNTIFVGEKFSMLKLS
ncbi:hypothetical protein [Pyrobaculum genetic element 1]|nr:hypothetical protein [Pyrobaculum genetic element 1]